MSTLSINFAEDLGPSPKIVHVASKGDLVSHSNLFYESGGSKPGAAAAAGAGAGAAAREGVENNGGGTGGGGAAGAAAAAERHHGAPMTDRLTQALLSHRDANNHGAWTFRRDAERDLLMHVENGLSISSSTSTSTGGGGGVGVEPSENDDDEAVLAEEEHRAASSILRSIDVYCLGKQWMYHVGHEKGEVIKPFVERCVRTRTAAGGGGPFVAAELGTYCGYSAILIAMTVRKCAPSLDFHLYSTEINPEYLEVARKIVSMAKLDRYVTLIAFDPAREKLSEVLGEAKKIDFLFLDHAKDRYLSDLHELERSGLIGRGSHVVADNVVVNSKELGAYREYLSGLAQEHVVETDMVEGRLEYTENLKDGIEFTVYLQDPPKR